MLRPVFDDGERARLLGVVSTPSVASPVRAAAAEQNGVTRPRPAAPPVAANGMNGITSPISNGTSMSLERTGGGSMRLSARQTGTHQSATGASGLFGRNRAASPSSSSSSSSSTGSEERRPPQRGYSSRLFSSSSIRLSAHPQHQQQQEQPPVAGNAAQPAHVAAHNNNTGGTFVSPASAAPATNVGATGFLSAGGASKPRQLTADTSSTFPSTVGLMDGHPGDADRTSMLQSGYYLYEDQDGDRGSGKHNPHHHHHRSWWRRARRAFDRALFKDTIPATERFLLNPVEKLLQYGKFPTKMFLNLVIVVVLLVYTYSYFAAGAALTIRERFGLASLLFSPNDYTAHSFTQTFNTEDSVVSFLQGIATGYYNVPDAATGVYMHYATDDPAHYGQPIPPMLKLLLLNENESMPWDPFHGSYQWQQFAMTPDTNFLGPFYPPILETLQAPITEQQYQSHCHPVGDSGVASDGMRYLPCLNNTLSNFFERIEAIKLWFPLRAVRQTNPDVRPSLIHWLVMFQCKFTAHRSSVVCLATFTPKITQQADSAALIPLFIIMALVSLDLILRGRSIWKYMQGREELRQVREHLTPAEKLLMEEMMAGKSWRFFGVFCDLLGFAFFIVGLMENLYTVSDAQMIIWRNLLLALNIFCWTLLLLGYLQTLPKYYVFIKAIAYAVPNLAYFIIGVLPIYVGFTLCYTVCFGGFTPTIFRDVWMTMYALFSATNGDSLLQIFTVINLTPFPLMRAFTRLLFAFFLMYFAAFVQNFIMAIVQNAYMKVTETFELCNFDDSRIGETAQQGRARQRRHRRRRKQLLRDVRRRQAIERGEPVPADATESSSTTTSDSDHQRPGDIIRRRRDDDGGGVDSSSDDDHDVDITDPRALKVLARRLQTKRFV